MKFLDPSHVADDNASRRREGMLDRYIPHTDGIWLDRTTNEFVTTSRHVKQTGDRMHRREPNWMGHDTREVLAGEVRPGDYIRRDGQFYPVFSVSDGAYRVDLFLGGGKGLLFNKNTRVTIHRKEVKPCTQQAPNIKHKYKKPILSDVYPDKPMPSTTMFEQQSLGAYDNPRISRGTVIDEAQGLTKEQFEPKIKNCTKDSERPTPTKLWPTILWVLSATAAVLTIMERFPA